MMLRLDLSEWCLDATTAEPALWVRTRLAHGVEVRWGLSVGGHNIAELGRLQGKIVVGAVGLRYDDVSAVLDLVIDEAARESSGGEHGSFDR